MNRWIQVNKDNSMKTNRMNTNQTSNNQTSNNQMSNSTQRVVANLEKGGTADPTHPSTPAESQAVDEGDRAQLPDRDSAASQANSVSDLLKQAAATVYWCPALRALGADLPADDSILMAALNKAADERNANAFINLYVAALYAERRIRAEVLERGAALLRHPFLLLHTPLRLEGDVAKSLAEAIRSGRMAPECDAIAVLTGSIYYKLRNVSVPRDFVALTRKVCRQVVRMNQFQLKDFLNVALEISGDTVGANILNSEKCGDLKLNSILETASKYSTEPGWDVAIPAERPMVDLGDGVTLTRAIPKVGRNQPCPCGSGMKFKLCCGKTSTGDQFAIKGVTVSDAISHPELILTEQRIRAMRSYDLYALDPKRMTPELAEMVAIGLARFHEVPRAIEVLQAIGREVVSADSLGKIALQFYVWKEIEALRWILAWAPAHVKMWSGFEVMLAIPEKRLHLLCEKASEAFEADRSGDPSSETLFCDLALAASVIDPALGIVVARGVLSACGEDRQKLMVEVIEDARDVLGLDDNEPGHGIVDATTQASRDAARHVKDLHNIQTEMSSRVSQRDAENGRLKIQLQNTLKAKEEVVRKLNDLKGKHAQGSAKVSSESAEISELKAEIRRLKANSSAEHEAHQRTSRELEALRGSNREKPDNQEPENPNDEVDVDDSACGDVEWERQALRKPQYVAAFWKSLERQPRGVYAASLILAARLAAGDPSAWKKVCPLKSRPGTFRATADCYRLLFEIGPENTLRIVDFILRRDLDRWLAAR